MGRRGKVVLARIENDSKRRESFRKRKAGLFKKVHELTTLCGAEGAVVIYSREDNQPAVWPSKDEAKEIVSKYFKRPKVERLSRSHTSMSFIEEKLKRKKNKAERMVKRNEERSLQVLITRIYQGKVLIQDLDSVQKKKLSEFADKRKKEFLKHIQKLTGRKTQVPRRPKALPPVLQIAPEAESGLNIHGLAGPEAGTDGQWKNVRATNILGMTARATSSLNMNAIVGRNFLFPAASHGQEMILGGNILDMARVYGQTNLGGVLQHGLPSPLFMPPTDPFATPIQSSYRPQVPPHVMQFPQVSEPRSGIDINALTVGRNLSSAAATAKGQQINIQGENRLDMTRRFYGQTNIGGMMQYPLPSPSPMRPPKPLGMSNVQSMASNLDTTDDGFITRPMTGHGDHGEMIHHASHPFLPIELPRRLGIPPGLLMQYDASGVDKIINEDGWTTTNFTTAGTSSLDQSSFGDEYRLNTNEFSEPATAGLNQSNIEDFTSNGIWDDFDTALGFDIEPYLWR